MRKIIAYIATSAGKICELYLKLPLPFVFRVTGASLSKRIEEIVSRRVGTRVSFAKKIALTVAGAVVATVPIVVGILNTPAARAQQRPESATGSASKFEAASVKRSQGDNTYMGVRRLSHGLVVIENMPLKALMGVAYQRREGWFEISGAPGWMDSEGYEISARAAGDASNEQMYPMLQALLRDRFQLKLHRETRNLPLYALVVAKGGLKLRNPKPGNCFAGAAGTEPPPVPGAPLVLPCGSITVSLAPFGLQIKGNRTSMQSLALILAGVLGRTVVDRTQFSGTFDIDLEFTPDDAVAGIPGRGMPGSLPTALPSGDSAGPSLFSAMQERVGLRLESARGPVTVFVIDHVEQPSPN